MSLLYISFFHFVQSLTFSFMLGALFSLTLFGNLFFHGSFSLAFVRFLASLTPMLLFRRLSLSVRLFFFSQMFVVRSVFLLFQLNATSPMADAYFG